MKLLQRVIGVVRLAFKRLWNHPGLTILALLGVVLSVGLVSNASFFSQAVDQVILNEELDAFSTMTGRPPFSTGVYAFTPSDAPISLEHAETLGDIVSGTLSDEVGLPVQHLGIQVHSGNMMLRPATGDTQFGEEDEFLGSVDMAYILDIEQHIDFTSGDAMVTEGTSGEVLDVWMHSRLAEKMGINTGEELAIGINVNADPTPIRVVGIWQATDPEDDYWFENPDATLQNVLLIRRQDYINTIQPLIPAKTWYLSWHIILDGSEVYPDMAAEYLEGFRRAGIVIEKYLPTAKINTPPLDPLNNFVTRGDTLTVLLLGFNLPAFGFLLYFLVLSSAIISQWQQHETATLVGRGMRPSSILTLTLAEEIMLFIVGYPLGVLTGMGLARAMGDVSSFLQFTSREALPISMRGLNIPVTLVALSVTLVARLIPAAQATRRSAKEVERERARPVKGPFWYRAYLDFILLIPTYYLYTQLSQRGSISSLVQDSPADLYSDPLLILVPTLFILAAALMILRLFPLLMRILDFIAGFIRFPTPHLALRQLGRRSQTYINPLLLVIVSLALGVYTISMAASLDQWLVDRMYYAAGTDLSFGVYPPEDSSSSSSSSEGGVSSIISGEWIPTPVEFMDLPGVNDATRVGNYSMGVNLVNTGNIKGRYMAVDRTDFSRVAWFRDDFADESLGALMNRLAATQDGILVSRKIYEENQMNVGDLISIRVAINYEFIVTTQFTIVGTYDYFPTVYDDDEITFIGNMDYLAFYVGMVVPHDVWMTYDSRADGDTILASIPTNLRVKTIREMDAPGMIRFEKSKLERVGVFGTLTIGFLAAVVMAMMGLLIYTYASLTERLHRFTILRAVGLLRNQIAGQVILEYAVLTAYGSIAGAGIGILASNLFVPLFRVTEEVGVPLPPLIPVIAYDQVQVLVAVFVAIIITMEVGVIVRSLGKKSFSMLKVWG